MKPPNQSQNKKSLKQKQRTLTPTNERHPTPKPTTQPERDTSNTPSACLWPSLSLSHCLSLFLSHLHVRDEADAEGRRRGVILELSQTLPYPRLDVTAQRSVGQRRRRVHLQIKHKTVHAGRQDQCMLSLLYTNLLPKAQPSRLKVRRAVHGQVQYS